MIDNDAAVPVPCPGCGAETEKTVGWLRSNPEQFTCSGCGRPVHLNPDEVRALAAVFDDVEKSVQGLSDTISGLNRL